MFDAEFEDICDFLADYNVFFWDFYDQYTEEPPKILVAAKKNVYEHVNLYLPFYYENKYIEVYLTDEEY